VEHLYIFHARGELFHDDVTSFERFDGDVDSDDISHKEAVERTFRRSIYELVGDNYIENREAVIFKFICWTSGIAIYVTTTFTKGLSKKDVRSKGWRLTSEDIFRTRDERGFFRCGRPHFFVQKHRVFEIYGVSPRTRGGGGG